MGRTKQTKLPKKDYQYEFQILISEASETAFNMMYEREFDPVYLYYIPGDYGKKFGRLIPVYDSDSHRGLKLAYNERLPRSLTHDQLRNWIMEKANRLPLLPLK